MLNENYLAVSSDFIKKNELVKLLKKFKKQFRFNIAKVVRQAQTESNLKINAVGSAGEIGLFQMKPNTYQYVLKYAKEHNEPLRFTGGLYDVNSQIESYLYYFNVIIPAQMKAYKIPDTYENRLRVYNAGIGNFWKSFNFKITNKYVQKILGVV